MAHTSQLARLLPVIMLAVALVTSPIAAFALSLSSPDPVTGMLVALVPPVHGLQPVQIHWNQVSTHLLYTTTFRCLITPFCCHITPFSWYIIENLVI